LDMGFIDDVSEIIGYTNNLRQTLMFSATFSDEVRALAKEYLRAPKSISPTLSPAATPKIVHVIHPVDPAQKIGAFLFILDQYPNQQILVFTRTKARADELAKRVTNHNIKSMATHSDRTQAYRTKAMACFRDGRIRVLVATDIAARGIDIDDLPLVVNYELPNLPEDYVHRIGRTGRAGAEGKAISLLTQGELCLLAPIEKLLKKQIPQIWLEGFFPKKFDPRASVKPEIRTRVRKSKWTK
ncbi:MAG: helicase-related protein, partial [Proteobacteria bacterium]|nr:helicase-related protein [Pseudomonadota bacterium]